jgi:hypothetical protein
MEQKQQTDYVRSLVTHITAEWSFEVLDAESLVSVVTIMTADGPVKIGLNRQDAEMLMQNIQLFLARFPNDQTAS